MALGTTSLSFALVFWGWKHSASLYQHLYCFFPLSRVCPCGIGRREPREGPVSEGEQPDVFKNKWKLAGWFRYTGRAMG